jgi:hypothetical protein
VKSKVGIKVELPKDSRGDGAHVRIAVNKYGIAASCG